MTSDNSLKILLVEDSASDAVLLKENILSSGAKDISISVVQSLAEAKEHLKNNNPDAVLLDLTLPDSSGLDTVREVRSISPDLPIVVLTGVDDENTGVEAVRAGVQDYLVKGQTDGRTITRVIRYSIERKNAEDALREREQLLQDVMDGSPSPIFLKDRDGKFITINASLERMLGMSRQELKGKTDYDIAPKEVADYWRSHDTKVMATGKAIQIEEVADLQDGHHIFLANKFPLVNANGQVYGVGAISHDITERKKTEEELQKLASVVRHSSEFVNIAALDGKMVFINEAGAEMIGLSAEEVERTHILQVIPDHLQDKVKNEVLPTLKENGLWQGELQYRNLKTSRLIRCVCDNVCR